MNPLELIIAIRDRLADPTNGIRTVSNGDDKITIDKITIDVNTFDGESGLFIYIRNGGIEIINPNVYCGILRHRIVIDIIGANSTPQTIKKVLCVYSELFGAFKDFGGYISSLDGQYELASSYLDSGGTFALPGNTGVGMEVSFFVDERLHQ